MSVNNIQNISFTGAGAQVADAAKACNIAAKYHAEKKVTKGIEKLMPKGVGWMNMFKHWNGEPYATLINAIGTGLVAPVFIRYNFLSKTDEDTRTYSALRQPISAVLAILTQVGITVPFSKAIDNMCNNGKFADSKYNKTQYQDIKYHEKLIARTNPTLSSEMVDSLKKANPGLKIDTTTRINDIKKLNSKLYKKTLTELASERQLGQFQELMNTLSTKNTIHLVGKDGKVQMKEEDLKKLFTETADSIDKQLVESLNRYVEEKPAKQIKRGEFLRDNESKVKAVLAEIQTETEKIQKATTSTVAKLTEEERTAADYKQISAFIKDKIKKLKSERAPQELIDIVSELGQKPSMFSLCEKINDVTKRCGEFSHCKSLTDVMQIITNEVKEDIKRVEAERSIIADIKHAADKGKGTIANILEKAGTLKESDFLYSVVQKHISKIEGNVKALRQITSLGVSIAILPLTCSLLNYVYPRFVRAFFPRLDKGSKEKDAFVKAAPNTYINHSQEVRK